LLIANPSANSSLTRRKVGQSLINKEGLRAGALSKASGKKKLYASIQAITEASIKNLVISFLTLFFWELPFIGLKWLRYSS